MNISRAIFWGLLLASMLAWFSWAGHQGRAFQDNRAHALLLALYLAAAMVASLALPPR